MTPSSACRKRMRLLLARSLIQGGIPAVLWAEDALSLVYRAPFTGVQEQQLLVPEDAVTEAVSVIRSDHPYTIADGNQDKQWADHAIFNRDKPYAFQNTATALLVHRNPDWVEKYGTPLRILVHSASMWHFEIYDKSRFCTIPDPPDLDETTQSVRFPTIAAFYDSLVDTMFELPLPFIHKKFDMKLQLYRAFLTDHLCDNGPQTTEAGELIPACRRVLEEVKEENSPRLTKQLRSLQAMERISMIKQARLQRMGSSFKQLKIPYDPWIRARAKLASPALPALPRLLSTLKPLMIMK
ncbi:hypothetical protein C8J56DRAFT_264701 [Mycena floridula]|nr:hypothetical protein C8J56DRAFT_264701 [Mycena floridula]